jgi:hypothetical protein
VDRAELGIAARDGSEIPRNASKRTAPREARSLHIAPREGEMTMNKLMMFAFVSSLATACSKKTASCEEIFAHTKSLAPEGMREAMEAKKESAIAKCEKLSDKAKQCAMDAKTMDDLQNCPRS